MKKVYIGLNAYKESILIGAIRILRLLKKYELSKEDCVILAGSKGRGELKKMLVNPRRFNAI